MKAETFQDPSVLMKRALFQSLLILAVTVVLYMFGVEPCQSDLQKARGELKAQSEQLLRMQTAVKNVDKNKADLEKIVPERQKYLDWLLEPLADSYERGAQDLLDPLAEEAGLAIRVPDESLQPRLLPLSPRLQPGPTSPEVQLYARKPIRVTCTGSYMSIISFLMNVEKKMPGAALEAFTLKTQKDPNNQSATMVFEWPIKGQKTGAVAQGGQKK